MNAAIYQMETVMLWKVGIQPMYEYESNHLSYEWKKQMTKMQKNETKGRLKRTKKNQKEFLNTLE